MCISNINILLGVIDVKIIENRKPSTNFVELTTKNGQMRRAEHVQGISYA